jgi:hypothetical protein|tara:strand:- start:412 stop:690 length:279 start_codon:yes stop_codon:yes gene_type:complete
MEPLNDLYKVTPEELIDAPSDGPRPLLLNPDPVEVQELFSEVHASLGDRDPKWSSDEDEVTQMNDKDFKQLVKSVKQMGSIMRGEDVSDWEE